MVFFSPGTIFWPNFPVGGGSHRVYEKGVYSETERSGKALKFYVNFEWVLLNPFDEKFPSLC